MLVFKHCCTLQLRENSEYWLNPSKNFAAGLDLSQRNMLLPISVNLCCLDFDHEVFQNYTDGLYSSWRNVLLLISENLCCLDSDHEENNWMLLSYTSAERITEWIPMCQHYSLYSRRKCEQVFPRDIFHLRDFSKSFFPFIQPPFLSCKYQPLFSLKTYQILVINEWPSVFSKQFVSLLLDSVFFLLVAKIAINFNY